MSQKSASLIDDAMGLGTISGRICSGGDYYLLKTENSVTSKKSMKIQRAEKKILSKYQNYFFPRLR
jgi:hypothetical protein